MSWDTAYNRLLSSPNASVDEGGILCQMCPPHREIRRGGRYVIPYENIEKVIAELKLCNTHQTHSFTFQLKYSYDAPLHPNDPLGPTWTVFKTYEAVPNTLSVFEEDVTSVVLPHNGPTYFMVLIDVDYNGGQWPADDDCDFAATLQIKNIVCEAPPLPNDQCRNGLRNVAGVS